MNGPGFLEVLPKKLSIKNLLAKRVSKTKKKLPKPERRVKTKKHYRKTDRTALELALTGIQSEKLMLSNPVIEDYTPRAVDCAIPFLLTEHNSPYQIIEHDWELRDSSDKTNTADKKPIPLQNLVYFKEDCIKDLVKGTNNRNVLVSYIKNIIFLEVYHKYGMSFENTIPVIGYGLLTNKSDMDFMYDAFGVLIKQGGRENINLIELALNGILNPKATEYILYLLNMLNKTEQEEVVKKYLEDFRIKAETIFPAQDISKIQKLFHAEKIKFQQILGIAHSVESLMILILVDLYCRIEYIENHFIYREYRDRLPDLKKIQYKTIRDYFHEEGTIPVITPNEQYMQQKKILEGKYEGAEKPEKLKTTDSKYKDLSNNYLNYLCKDIFLFPGAYNYELNSHFRNIDNTYIPYFRYALDFSKVSFQFDDDTSIRTRSSDIRLFKTRIDFPNKEYYRKAISILKETFSFTFQSDTGNAPVPEDKTKYFSTFRLHDNATDFFLELIVQKNNITKYLSTYEETADIFKSATVLSPNVLAFQNDPERFGVRIGTKGVEIEKAEHTAERGYYGAFGIARTLGKKLGQGTFEALGKFIIQVLGVQTKEEGYELIKAFANEYKERYKKEELLFIQSEYILTETKKLVEDPSVARQVVRYLTAPIKEVEARTVQHGVFPVVTALSTAVSLVNPVDKKEISIYSKKSLPASVTDYYKKDIIKDVFMNRFYPKTKVPQLLESDVKFAILAASAYIPNVDIKTGEAINKDKLSKIKVGTTELHYLPIFTDKKDTSGFPILNEKFTHFEKFNSRDFLDENKLENIRFYYEKPVGFDELVKSIIDIYGKIQKGDSYFKKTVNTIERLKNQLDKERSNLKIKEERFRDANKVKDELNKREENINDELDKISSAIEFEVDSIKTHLLNEYNKTFEELQNKLQKLRQQHALTQAKKELLKLEKEIKRLEEIIANMEGKNSNINSLTNTNDKILEKSKKLDKLHEQENKLEKIIEQIQTASEKISGKVNMYKKDLELQKKSIDSIEKEIKNEEEKLKRLESKKLKQVFLALKNKLKENPFNLIIAYRGTEFETQTYRDLLSSDVLLAIGKDELDPRFTIVNRISSNINLFREFIGVKILESISTLLDAPPTSEKAPAGLVVPEEIKKYFLNEIRLQIFSTGHSLGGTLSLMSTYYSYINPIPASLRKYVGNVILSVGFNAGAGVPIIQKFKKLPQNSFRLYRNNGDVISFCFKYFKDEFVNSRNIVNIPCTHSTKIKDMIQNHGMSNILGIVNISRLEGINITKEDIDAITYDKPLILYGEGKSDKVSDSLVYEKVTIYPASRQIEKEFQEIEEKQRRNAEILATRAEERKVAKEAGEVAAAASTAATKELVKGVGIRMMGGTRRNRKNNRLTRKNT